MTDAAMTTNPVTLLDAELAATACAHKLDSGDRVDLYNALQALAEGRTACVSAERLAELERDAGWQPIETAPKDGTAIMLCNEIGSWVGKYVPVYQSGFKPTDPWFSLMLNHDHIPRVAGRFNTPTLWMPLPVPPARASEAKR